MAGVVIGLIAGWFIRGRRTGADQASATAAPTADTEIAAASPETSTETSVEETAPVESTETATVVEPAPAEEPVVEPIAAA
ncbi:hypothetical protein, partial [Actinoplanes regularis]|uniref:hypothetical protein n=1 Tax=Actinoplanes regularis TaxID=52697 RepID=UPI0035A25B0A